MFNSVKTDVAKEAARTNALRNKFLHSRKVAKDNAHDLLTSRKAFVSSLAAGALTGWLVTSPEADRVDAQTRPEESNPEEDRDKDLDISHEPPRRETSVLGRAVDQVVKHGTGLLMTILAAKVTELTRSSRNDQAANATEKEDNMS